MQPDIVLNTTKRIKFIVVIPFKTGKNATAKKIYEGEKESFSSVVIPFKTGKNATETWVRDEKVMTEDDCRNSLQNGKECNSHLL